MIDDDDDDDDDDIGPQEQSSGTRSGPISTPVGGGKLRWLRCSFNARRIFGRAAMGRIGSPEKI